MGKPTNVLVEFSPAAIRGKALPTFVPGREMAAEAAAPAKVPGFEIDASFGAVPMPKLVPRKAAEMDPFDIGPEFSVDAAPEVSNYLVRGTIDSDAINEAGVNFDRSQGIVAVYSDPRIQPCITCPSTPPVGTAANVANLLGVPLLARRGMDGTGVYVAVVDTGINLPYLNAHGKHPHTDSAKSWVPHAGLVPFNIPVNHGTMCAYDVCIAAPKCTLLDVAVLQSTTPGGSIMDGLLSDAVRAYSFLLRIMLAPHRPGDARSMVVTNSWGMFHPSWDFPPGNPGRYMDNPNHPFNRIVGSLERAGADILFAAGNCGRDCPDSRCQGYTTGGIYGANGHPQVICIAGVDITKARVGYSSSGPGLLSRMKPDLTCYTHFSGSLVYPADGGTSAACPTAAGVVAAFRAKFPYDRTNIKTHPAAIHSLLEHTAEDRGAVGFDFDYGWGIINGRKLATITTLTVMEPEAVVEVTEERAPAVERVQQVEAAAAAEVAELAKV